MPLVLMLIFTFLLFILSNLANSLFTLLAKSKPTFMFLYLSNLANLSRTLFIVWIDLPYTKSNLDFLLPSISLSFFSTASIFFKALAVSTSIEALADCFAKSFIDFSTELKDFSNSLSSAVIFISSVLSAILSPQNKKPLVKYMTKD